MKTIEWLNAQAGNGRLRNRLYAEALADFAVAALGKDACAMRESAASLSMTADLEVGEKGRAFTAACLGLESLLTDEDGDAVPVPGDTKALMAALSLVSARLKELADND